MNIFYKILFFLCFLTLIAFIYSKYNKLSENLKNNSVSFEKDIKPLFKPIDIQSMNDRGLDLENYNQIKERAPLIYKRLSEGSMPCYGPWPKKNIQLFKKWIDGGYNK